jgi:hypothetical protein
MGSCKLIAKTVSIGLCSTHLAQVGIVQFATSAASSLRHALVPGGDRFRLEQAGWVLAQTPEFVQAVCSGVRLIGFLGKPIQSVDG